MNPPELEVLDQLQGGDMPLAMVVALFSDQLRAKHAIGALIQAGDVELLDDCGTVVPGWRWDEIQRDSEAWATVSELFLRLTDAGAKKA